MLQYKTPGFVHRMTAAEYKLWIERGQIPAWITTERKAIRAEREAEREKIWGGDV